MNFKVEHAIIAVLVLVLLYYVYSHRSLRRDLSLVPNKGNPHLKAVKEKHFLPFVVPAGVQAIGGMLGTVGVFGAGAAALG